MLASNGVAGGVTAPALELADQRRRAVRIVEGFFEAMPGRISPVLRGSLWAYLATGDGQEAARRAVLDQYGYVSMYPDGFVALQVATGRYDGPPDLEFPLAAEWAAS